MMTNIMMFGSLVAMETVPALVRCHRGRFLTAITEKKTPIHSGKKPSFAMHGDGTSFSKVSQRVLSYNDNWEKTPIQASKKPFFADHVYIGLCNEPKMAFWRWLFTEKRIWKVEIYNKNSPDRQYFWYIALKVNYPSAWAQRKLKKLKT